MLIELICHPENITKSDQKLENSLPWESSYLTNLLDQGTFSRLALISQLSHEYPAVRGALIAGKGLGNRKSDGNLMETFIQRSSDLLSIVNKLKKNSTNINYDDDFEALAHDFIQTRMKDLLERYVIILECRDGYYEAFSFKSFLRYDIDFI